MANAQLPRKLVAHTGAAAGFRWRIRASAYDERPRSSKVVPGRTTPDQVGGRLYEESRQLPPYCGHTLDAVGL